MNLTTLQYKIFVWLAFSGLVLSTPLAFVLPVEWSFENGLIENAQIVVLLGGIILILSVRSSMKWFQRFFAAGLLLIVFRELSWGRVFFPTGMEKLGPVFVSMKDYEYRLPVYIFLAAYISTMLFMLIYFVPVKKILAAPQPWELFTVMVSAIIFSSIGEHTHLLDRTCGQIFEELNELILYATLPVAALYYCRGDA